MKLITFGIIFTSVVCFSQCEFHAGGTTGQSTFAIGIDSTLWSWGRNDYGQLGNGTTSDKIIPTQVQGETGGEFLSDVIKIEGGDRHIIALKSDKTVWAWGRNDYRQVWVHDDTDRRRPFHIGTFDYVGFEPYVIDIAAGGNYSLVVKSDGYVWAWGNNVVGQCGDGTTESWHTIRRVVGPGGSGYLTGITKVDGGGGHSIARKSDGTVWCWGSNGHGRLGNDGSSSSSTPVQVVGSGGSGYLSGVTEVKAGEEFSMALKTDGSVWTWGRGCEGQRGDGTADASCRIPVRVKGPGGVGYLIGVEEIAAGYQHALALKSDGTVWAWGKNLCGQLGDGTTTYQNTPIQVHGIDGIGFLEDVVSISAGENHSIAVMSDGTTLVWGRNSYGQVGDSTLEQRNYPVVIFCEFENIEIHIKRGWNLVSVPSSEPQSWTVFGGVPYGYDPAIADYYTSDSLHSDKGYFVLSMIADTIGLSGDLGNYSDTLFPGWNLIGSVDHTISRHNITTTPSGLFIPPLFGWNGTDYFYTDSLKPGNGYWFLSTGHGRLNVNE